MGFFETFILTLLFISLIMNIFLYLKVKQLNTELRDVGSKVELTKEELSQIRSRIEKMRKEF
ncbi:MAG: hypothetical protein H0Z28_05825 [Archaeoglobus sp.]|jgi:cell division protein FtsL|nr:hypothetical protein [Archaeoglobus sp.]